MSLSFADYLLWDWSQSDGHGVLGLVAGLTLTLLLIALAWLVIVGCTRTIAGTARRARERSGAATGEGRRHAGTAARRARTPAQPARERAGTAVAAAGEPAGAAPQSSKLAA